MQYTHTIHSNHIISGEIHSRISPYTVAVKNDTNGGTTSLFLFVLAMRHTKEKKKERKRKFFFIFIFSLLQIFKETCDEVMRYSSQSLKCFND